MLTFFFCSVYLQITRTTIISRTSSKLGQVRPRTSQPSQKQRKQFNICLLVKHQVQMQFMLKSIKLVYFQWQKKLTELFQCMWRKEAIIQDFKDASITHIYKRKANPQVCDNLRGILSYQLLGRYWQKFY